MDFPVPVMFHYFKLYQNKHGKMVDSDNGEETVHCFTLYFSLSNVLSFYKML